MRAALKALNELVSNGIINSYAIGGAIGAAFYIQAIQTEDIDAFTVLPASNSGLVTLTPVYTALTGMGGVVEREHVRFGEWPLQILTDANSLIAEAIADAIDVDYEGIPTRVFRPEHLCAVALQTGRVKDYARVSLFIEQGAVDGDQLATILGRFNLLSRLEKLIAFPAEQGPQGQS